MIRYGSWRLIFIISVFSILLLNAVSATDDGILNENSLPDHPENSIALNENGNILSENANDKETESIEMKTNLKSSNEGFDAIQKLIDDANDGDSIYLENENYKGNGTPIQVNKSVNIYGFQYENNQKSILDADSKSNIFIVNENIHLNLYGLKLINGNSYTGGTIYNKGSLNIFNSTFENNKGEYGGAIYNSKDLEIHDSSFDKNTAFEAGAIYNNANLLIENSNFTKQSVSHKAGVIFSSGNLNIDKSIFNRTTGADEGGAIFTFGGTATINSTKFLSNKALSYGAGIDNSGMMTIENCIFDRNSAYGAGAIDNGGNLTVINSVFTENKATMNGGAIDSNQILKVIGSVFENNSAGRNGGTILSRSNITLSHCSIVNNSDSQGYGIFAQEGEISLNNNWWGLNNPKFEEIININIGDDFRWIIMNFTNETPLNQNSDSELMISFNQTIDKNNNHYALEDSSKLALLKGIIVLEGDSEKTSFEVNIENGSFLKSFYINLNKTVSAIVNDQTISLNLFEKEGTDGNDNESSNGNTDEKSDTDAKDNNNGNTNENRSRENIGEYDDDANPNNQSKDTCDFNKTKDFNLNKFKAKDFIKSIHSKFINSNLDNLKSSNYEINGKEEEYNENDEGLNDWNISLNYLIPISAIILALLILIAFRRKKDEEDEN